MKKGFTIIELLVVMAILIAVTTGSVVSYTRMTKDMKVKEYNRIIEEFEAAAEVYVASNYALREKVYSETGYVVVTLKALDSEGLISLLKQTDPVTGNSFNASNYINIRLDDEHNLLAEYMSDADYVFTTPGDIYGIPVGSTYGREEMLDSLIGYYKGEFDQTTGTYNLKNIDLDKVEISVTNITDESAPVEIDIDEILTTTSHLNDTFEITYTYNFPDGEKEIVRKARVSQYTETLLNGTDPVIEGDLIPVKLSSNNNDWTVTYADTTKEWYKYGKSEWANAVRLKANPSQNYNVGDIIKHDDISAYFVWIPKYKYKLFDMGNYNGTVPSVTPKNQLIEIEFGTINTADVLTGDTQSCVTPMTSGTSGNCAVNRWMTHPAFISFNKNGFWVGKFETTGSLVSLTVLPEYKSLTNKSVVDFMSYLYDYNRPLDSHLIKNTEWGAVAYLSNSIYGRKNTEIWINNNINFITGCVGVNIASGGVDGCSNKWYSKVGINGSTTGNVTGIYDMSGGTSEYVASFRQDYGYDNAIISDKYYDLYNVLSSGETYSYRILGDATGEMGPFLTGSSNKSGWYSDRSIFISSDKKVFLRSGNPNASSNSGIFAFISHTGGLVSTFGSRLVLTP